MSVYTKADELRDKAKEHINAAYKCLDQILDPEADTWGTNYFSKAYLITLEEITLQLRKMRREI